MYFYFSIYIPAEVCCLSTRLPNTTEYDVSRTETYSTNTKLQPIEESQPKLYIVIAVVIPLLAFLVIVSLCISKW